MREHYVARSVLAIDDSVAIGNHLQILDSPIAGVAAHPREELSGIGQNLWYQMWNRAQREAALPGAQDGHRIDTGGAAGGQVASQGGDSA